MNAIVRLLVCLPWTLMSPGRIIPLAPNAPHKNSLLHHKNSKNRKTPTELYAIRRFGVEKCSNLLGQLIFRVNPPVRYAYYLILNS